MYLKFTVLSLLVITTSLFGEIKIKPQIEYTRISYEALKKDPNKGFLEQMQDREGHPLILMHLKNFPRDKPINLSIQRMLFSKENCKFYDFILEKSANDSMFIPPWMFLPGEKIKIIFNSLDDKFKYSTTYIPNPIQLKDQEGKVVLSAELTMSTPTMDCYEVSLFGIPDKEKLKIKSVSEDEVIEYPLIFSEKDKIRLVPGVNWKKGGLSQLTITRSSGDKLTINLPWGSELYKYVDGKEIFDPEKI